MRHILPLVAVFMAVLSPIPPAAAQTSESRPTLANAPPFFDDFTQPDGPALNWFVSQPGRSIAVEAGEYSLETFNTGQYEDEAVTFAGTSPIAFTGDLAIEFDVDFKSFPADDVGRHAGMMFYAQDPLDRAFTSGYTIDWIDRFGDHGYRILRFEGAFQVVLGIFGALDQDPGHHWKAVVHGSLISLEVDGIRKGHVTDNTYRTGLFSLWAAANGQHVHFDNVSVSPTCEATLAIAGDVHTPGSTVQVRVHIAHRRPEIVTVPWELTLLDSQGRTITERITEPITFAPGDTLDRDLDFRLPDDLASGSYKLKLAISGMAGTKGATTTLRVVRAE